MRTISKEHKEKKNQAKEQKNKELVASAANAIKLARASAAEEKKAPINKKKEERELEIDEEIKDLLELSTPSTQEMSIQVDMDEVAPE